MTLRGHRSSLGHDAHPPRWSPGRWREHVARTLQTISMHEDSVFDKLAPKSQTTNDLGEDVRLCALRYVTLEGKERANSASAVALRVTMAYRAAREKATARDSVDILGSGWNSANHQQPSGRGVVVRNSRKAKAAKIPNGGEQLFERCSAAGGNSAGRVRRPVLHGCLPRVLGSMPMGPQT